MPILIVASLSIIALNCYATVRLLRSESYSRQQMRLQSMLVWVFPVVGAITVLTVMAADRAESVPVRGIDDSPRDGMSGIGLYDTTSNPVDFNPSAHDVNQ